MSDEEDAYRKVLDACDSQLDRERKDLLRILDSDTVRLTEIKRRLIACQKQLAECRERLNRRFFNEVIVDLEEETLDRIYVNDTFANYLREKIFKSMETNIPQRSLTVWRIKRVSTDNEDKVKLEFGVSCDDLEILTVEIPKSRFEELHHLDPDKIEFDVYEMNNICIPEEIKQVFRQEIAKELERQSDEVYDFRKCNKIRVVRISKSCAYEDRVRMFFDMLFDIPEEGRYTPDQTTHVTLELNEKSFRHCRDVNSQLIMSTCLFHGVWEED